MCLSMVVQILSWIHREQLFFSINEKPSLTRIWTQDPLEKIYKDPALPSELFCLFHWNVHICIIKITYRCKVATFVWYERNYCAVWWEGIFVEWKETIFIFNIFDIQFSLPKNWSIKKSDQTALIIHFKASGCCCCCCCFVIS